MKLQDKPQLIGRLIARKIVDGVVIEERKAPNQIVDAGRDHVADMLGALNTRGFTYIAVGTGPILAQSTYTGLPGTELTTSGADRAAATVTRSGATLNLLHTFALTAAFSITEYGIFNKGTSSQPTMLSVQAQSTLNLNSGDKLQVDWSIFVSA